MTTLTATTPLLRERDFLRLWTAQTVSDFGARIAREGLPIMAVLVLSTGPKGLGVLAAVRGRRRSPSASPPEVSSTDGGAGR